METAWVSLTLLLSRIVMFLVELMLPITEPNFEEGPAELRVVEVC